jgi:hypothetical protein
LQLQSEGIVMRRKVDPELQQAAQRIHAIGEHCMADEFPMFRRRLTLPLSLLGGALLIIAQLLDYLAPMQYESIKIGLRIAGALVLAATLALRLWPRMWK